VTSVLFYFANRCGWQPDALPFLLVEASGFRKPQPLPKDFHRTAPLPATTLQSLRRWLLEPIIRLFACHGTATTCILL
jgi:hypothetical protein